MGETFSRRWTGWIQSSLGYSVRIVGRNRLEYFDESQRLDLFVEPLANHSDIVLDTTSFPDLPAETRIEVIDRLHRAFRFAGWTLIESDPSASGQNR